MQFVGSRKILHRIRSTRFLSKTVENNLARQLKFRIQATGPITIADYMKEVLTNRQCGYYMSKDVFGSKGDFITSPEISQMFGELIGVWCVNEWINCGSPKEVSLVELGPGRGTLTDDVLRVFSKFQGITDAVSVHMVEVSPKLSAIQKTKLAIESDRDNTKHDEDKLWYQHCKSKYGPDVYWYDHLRHVPCGYSFYIANEFFDALPIHIFQKKNSKWHEVLIDYDDTTSEENAFKYVLTKGETFASKALLQFYQSDARDHIEVSPDSGTVIQEITSRIASHGGSALIADYGHNGDKSDTLRGFKQHNLHNVLIDPGSADLTADVDFSFLKNMCPKEVNTIGPITQESFLKNMGIQLRMQVLLRQASREQIKDLMTGYDMLTNPEKMGERFKFFSVFKNQCDSYIPAGFIVQ